MPYIPNPQERRAIISALTNHHLLDIHSKDVDSLLCITPKGREYVEFRGYPVPLPSTAAPSPILNEAKVEKTTPPSKLQTKRKN